MELKPDWGKGYTRKATALARMGNERGAMMAYQTGMEKCPDDAALRQAAMKLQNAINTKLAQQLFPENYLDILKANAVTKKYLEDPRYAQMLELVKQQPSLLGSVAQMDPRIQVTLQVLSGVPVSVDPTAQAQQKEEAKPRVRQTRNHWAPKPKKEEKKDGDNKDDENKKEEPKEEDPRVLEAENFKQEGNKLYVEFERFNYTSLSLSLSCCLFLILISFSTQLALSNTQVQGKEFYGCDREV